MKNCSASLLIRKMKINPKCGTTFHLLEWLKLEQDNFEHL